MADGNSKIGGEYLGADGRLHDGNGKLLDEADTDAEALAEQRRSAGLDATSEVEKPAKKGAKK